MIVQDKTRANRKGQVRPSDSGSIRKNKPPPALREAEETNWGKFSHNSLFWWRQLKFAVPQPLTCNTRRWTASAIQLVRAYALHVSLDLHQTANKQIMSFWEVTLNSCSLLTLIGSTPSVHYHGKEKQTQKQQKAKIAKVLLFFYFLRGGGDPSGREPL